MLKYFKTTSGLATFNITFEGSNLEQPNELGAAHLLEHLVCYNLKKFEDGFELNGIEHNAMTGPTYTSYYIRGLDEKVKHFAQSFYNAIVTKPLQVSEKEFEEEKRIIIQEWHDDTSNPESNLINRFYLEYYHTPRTIGSLAALENLSFKSFKEMYHRHFQQPLYCLIEQSSDWEITDWAPYKTTHDSIFELNLDGKKKTKFPQNKGSNPSLLMISDNFTSEITEHFIINCMLVDGLNSPLMKELREKHQLIYGMYGNLEMVNPYLGHSKFVTSTQKENKDKVWRIFKKVINSRDWVTEQKFKQTVERNLIENEIMKRMYQCSDIMSFLNPYEELITKEIKNITFKQVKDLVNKKYYDKYFLLFD